MTATRSIDTGTPTASWEQLAATYGPQREPLPPVGGDRACRFCRAGDGIRWVLPLGGSDARAWLCELCAEAAQRIGRAPEPRPDPEGCRFTAEVSPGGRAAFVSGWVECPVYRSLGYAIVYRAEEGDERAYRIDVSGCELIGTRHYSGAACLAEAIADAKVLLALRRG